MRGLESVVHGWGRYVSRGLSVLILVAGASIPAFAQSDAVPQQFMQLFNSLLTQAQGNQWAQQNAANAWAQIDAATAACVQARTGYSVQQWANAAVFPTNRRVFPYVNACRQERTQVVVGPQPRQAPTYTNSPPQPRTDVSPSFDCAQVTKAADRAVCANSTLAALDNRMAAGFAEVKEAIGADRTELASFIKEQRLSLQQKWDCQSDGGCLRQWYERRIAQLSQHRDDIKDRRRKKDLAAKSREDDRRSFARTDRITLIYIEWGLVHEDAFKGDLSGSMGPAFRKAVDTWLSSHKMDNRGYLTPAQVQVLVTDARRNAGNGLAAALENDANRFVLDGGEHDVLMLLNTSSTAPHLVIDLKGEPKFSGGIATGCFVGSVLTDFDSSDEIWSALTKYGVARGEDQFPVCNLAQLDSYDFIIGQRLNFLNLAPQDFELLDHALHAHAWNSKTVTFREADRKAAADKRAILSQANADKIVKGGAEGWGYLIANNRSVGICVVARNYGDVPVSLARHDAGTLLHDLGEQVSFTYAPLDADTAFIETKKDRCRIVMGAQPDLKALLSAFERDRISVRVSSIWHAESEIDSRLTSEVRERMRDAQNDADARRKREAQRILDNKVKEALHQKWLADTAALHRANEAKVTSLVTELKQQLIQLLHAPTDASLALAKLYPDLAESVRTRFLQGWEVTGEDVAIVDFGSGEWRSRTLDVVMVKATIALKNREIGGYDTDCFLLASVDDPEFSMTREPLLIPNCANEGTAFDDYKAGLGFRSKWFATEENLSEDVAAALRQRFERQQVPTTGKN